MRTPRFFDVVLLGCVLLTQFGSTRSWPRCPSPQEFALAIERLLARPWTELTVEEAFSDWPLKLEQTPCALVPCSDSLHAWLVLDLWCRRCGVIAQPVAVPFSETSLTVGVDAQIWAPHPATRDANVDLLIRATHAPPGALRQADPSHQVWRWKQGTIQMGLHVARFGELEDHSARLELRSCSPPSHFKAERLDAATVMHMYQPPWAHDADSEPDELWVRYYTDCTIYDVGCLRDEAQRFWPHFHDEAERQRKSIVWFSFEDCFGVSSAVSYERTSAGVWSDPWSSRSSECCCPAP